MTHIEQERVSAIEEARAAPFLDAVFAILRFNLDRNRSKKVDDLGPHEVWDEVDELAYAEARKRAAALYASRFEVGYEFHQCRESPNGTQALRAKVERLHPGFGDATYGQVIWDGAIAER